MKQLPDSFQFRHKNNKGFTHSCKKNAHGDYEVTWARGWAEFIKQVPWRTEVESYVNGAVEVGEWLVVEDKPKQEETKLPDDFYFQISDNRDKEVFHAEKIRHETFLITWQSSAHGKVGQTYSKRQVEDIVASKAWKILDKKPLTAEQQRTLKEFREQVQQLDSSIKIQEQDIEHKRRLISNYTQRQQELVAKIKDLEGK